MLDNGGVRTPLLVVTLAAVAAGCGSDSGELPQGSEPVEIRPGDFTLEIDNPYWPMIPGSKWVYREGEQLVEVTVTDRTRTILGIEARVVHDVVTEGGQLVEDTYDWYAQDADGNVWYLGEDTKEYEDGEVVSTEGSWEAGVDGAQPGVVMPAEPRPGLTYRQEYYEGEAEDAAEVLSLEERAQVPFGAFEDVLQTEEHSPLEPGLVEHKYYVRGVGPVLAVIVSGGSGREELVRFTKP